MRDGYLRGLLSRTPTARQVDVLAAFVATREARIKRVLARANALLRPPITTVAVQAGDSLSAIASSHGLTLAALLAFPENAKYRANPGLIHPGDIVRVK